MSSEQAVADTSDASPSPMVTCPPSENKALGPLAKLVLPRIFKLYDLTGGAEDYKLYAENAVFEDPLMRAQGVKQIKSAFYSMIVLFQEAEIKEYSVTEKQTSEATGQVVVDNVQHYKMFGKEFDMVSRINLHVQNGLVTLHQDLWDRKPLATRETSGIAGWASQGARRASMLTTHILMGFGRDIKPKTKA